MNDQQILDYLRSRADVEPPMDLVGATAHALAATRQQRRSWFAAYAPPALAAAAVLVLVLVLVSQLPLIGPAPSASPAASTSTASASGSPTSLPSRTSTAFVPEYGSFARVAVPSLSLYAEQDLESPVVGEAIISATGEGQLLYVTDRAADPGWRRVEASVSLDVGYGWIFAWVPVEVDGQSTLRPAQVVPCPQRADVPSMADMSPPQQLACFGSDTLVLDGWAQEADFGAAPRGTPAWLAFPPQIGVLHGSPESWGPIVPVHVDPSAGDFPIGEQVRVSGHFNDARSSTCRRTDLPTGVSETAEESALWCAQQFVVDQIRRVAPVPTPASVTYRTETGSPFTIIDSAAADALFAQVDTCTNLVGRFTVEFPASWYTNPTIGNLPACTWFAPVPFAVSSVDVVPDDVAIVVSAFEGGFGFLTSPKTTLWEEISLDGAQGTRFEQVGAGYEAGGFEAQPPSYNYIADFGGGGFEVGPSLWAHTDSVGAADYVLNKAVLDRIMASLIYKRGS